MRERLTFANVISCIALFVALSGSALAIKANSVGSRQVRDDSLKGRDVRDGALKGQDLEAGAIGTRELDRIPGATQLKSGAGPCDPTSTTFVDCATVSLNLSQPSQVLLIGAGGQYGATDGRGACRFVADGVTLLGAASPHFGSATDKAVDETNGLALTAVAGSLDRIPPGLRSFRLVCNQVGPEDVKFQTTLSAVAFGDGLG